MSNISNQCSRLVFTKNNPPLGAIISVFRVTEARAARTILSSHCFPSLLTFNFPNLVNFKLPFV